MLIFFGDAIVEVDKVVFYCGYRSYAFDPLCAPAPDCGGTFGFRQDRHGFGPISVLGAASRRPEPGCSGFTFMLLCGAGGPKSLSFWALRLFGDIFCALSGMRPSARPSSRPAAW